jgi:hypothetical protein
MEVHYIRKKWIFHKDVGPDSRRGESGVPILQIIACIPVNALTKIPTSIVK